MSEIWKPVKGYELDYEVSNLGRIKSIKGEPKIMKLQVNKQNYLSVCLHIKGKQRNRFVHRLVAKTFIDNPENKKEVNHIDYNRQNNRVENLEWVTKLENINLALSRKGAIYGDEAKKLKNRVITAKKNLPKSGVTSLFFHYFKDEYNDSVKNKSKLNNVLQGRTSDYEITERLEELVELLNNK